MSKTSHQNNGKRHSYRADSPRHNTDFRDKLTKVVGETPLVVSSLTGRKSVYRPADSWKKDGEDHINIDFFGETELGRMLDFGNRLSFNHNIFKTFHTVSGFWYYIRSNERLETLRYAVGRALQNISKTLTNRKVSHVKAMVMDAAYQRIVQNPHLKQLMYQNELPFDTYRVADTGVRMRSSNYEWLVAGYSEIQRAIQTSELPNFQMLCDDPSTPVADIYVSVRPEIPDSVKQRLANRKNKQNFQKTPQTNPVREKTNAPTPSKTPEGKAKGVTSKAHKDDYTFQPQSGYSLMVPVCNEATDSLFLSEGKKIIKINNIPLQTGFLVTSVELPVIQMSDDQQLIELGLINKSDVVRAGPILERTFNSTFLSNNIIKLDNIAVKTAFVNPTLQTETMFVPLWLKLINTSFNREGDEQIVAYDHETQMVTVKRSIYLYKPMTQIVNNEGETPAVVKRVLDLKFPEGEKGKYVVMHMNFELKIRMEQVEELCPIVFFSGKIAVVGISTGSHDDHKRTTLLLTDEADLNDYHEIEGFNFTLYRGQLKSEVVEATPTVSESVVTEVSPVLEESPVTERDESLKQDFIATNYNYCGY